MLAPQILFENMIAGYASRRSLIRTSRRNILCLGPVVAREGDEMWFLQGARVPFVLRPLGNGNHELVGEAYVHGFMQGEIFTKGGLSVSNAVGVTLQ